MGKQCAVCGDKCQTNVRLLWRRDKDKKTFHICLSCAEQDKVNENSVVERQSKGYSSTTLD